MATSVGTIYLRGRSGQGYIKDLYIVDTAEALDRWDAGNGSSSTSPDYFSPPEDVIIEKYVQVAATGQTRTSIDINNQPTGNILRNSEHIPSATIIGTPYIGVKVAAGYKISLRAIA